MLLFPSVDFAFIFTRWSEWPSVSGCLVNSTFQYPLVSKTSSPVLQLTGHTRTVYAVAWAPSPIRTESSVTKSTTEVRSLPTSALSWPLASASADGTVRVWWISPSLLNSTSHDRKTTEKGRRPTIVSVSEEGVPHLPPHVGHGSIRAGETSHKGVFCAVLGHPGFVYSLAFRALGKPVSSAQLGDPLRDWLSPQTSHMLATAGYDRSVRLWNIGSRRAEVSGTTGEGHDVFILHYSCRYVKVTIVCSSLWGFLSCHLSSYWVLGKPIQITKVAYNNL